MRRFAKRTKVTEVMGSLTFSDMRLTHQTEITCAQHVEVLLVLDRREHLSSIEVAMTTQTHIRQVRGSVQRKLASDSGQI